MTYFVIKVGAWSEFTFSDLSSHIVLTGQSNLDNDCLDRNQKEEGMDGEINLKKIKVASQEAILEIIAERSVRE